VANMPCYLEQEFEKAFVMYEWTASVVADLLTYLDEDAVRRTQNIQESFWDRKEHEHKYEVGLSSDDNYLRLLVMTLSVSNNTKRSTTMFGKSSRRCIKNVIQN
jgi:hypothetical protein